MVKVAVRKETEELLIVKVDLGDDKHLFEKEQEVYPVPGSFSPDTIQNVVLQRLCMAAPTVGILSMRARNQKLFVAYNPEWGWWNVLNSIVKDLESTFGKKTFVSVEEVYELKRC